MSTEPKKTPEFNMADYLPAADDAQESDELDLGFGLDDEGNDISEDDTADAAGKDDDESSDKEDPDTEDESDKEAGNAGDDPDGEGNEKPDKEAGKDKAEDEKTKKPMVPKSRLDQVLAANRALKAELEAAKAATSKPDTDKDEADKFDFNKAEREYMDAVLEGQTEKALEIRANIRKAERAEGTEVQNANRDQVRTQEAVLKATADIEREFPVLNSESKEYNEAIANEMIELYAGYVATGKPPLDALSRALEMVVKVHDLVGDEKQEPSTTPGKDLKEKLKASKQQPPAPKRGERPKKEIDADTVDVMSLSDDEWDALPETVKAKYRGDFL